MSDTINPDHYKSEMGFETIDIIEEFDLGYHLGNAMKYITRAGVKDELTETEDLEKAQWYLNRWLTQDRDKRFVPAPAWASTGIHTGDISSAFPNIPENICMHIDDVLDDTHSEDKGYLVESVAELRDAVQHRVNDLNGEENWRCIL